MNKFTLLFAVGAAILGSTALVKVVMASETSLLRHNLLQLQADVAATAQSKCPSAPEPSQCKTDFRLLSTDVLALIGKATNASTAENESERISIVSEMKGGYAQSAQLYHTLVERHVALDN